MGLARFIAQDPYAPAATKQELEFFISRMLAVREWTIHTDGDVTIVYDPHRICGETIEEVLSRNGFQLKHILDDPNADETQVSQALGAEST